MAYRNDHSFDMDVVRRLLAEITSILEVAKATSVVCRTPGCNRAQAEELNRLLGDASRLGRALAVVLQRRQEADFHTHRA